MPRRSVGRERTAVTDVGTRYKTIAQNRRARFNYDLFDQFEAGIVLSGTEIKSVREGRVNIAEAYARIRGGEKGELLGVEPQTFTCIIFKNDVMQTD